MAKNWIFILKSSRFSPKIRIFFKKKVWSKVGNFVFFLKLAAKNKFLGTKNEGLEQCANLHVDELLLLYIQTMGKKIWIFKGPNDD